VVNLARQHNKFGEMDNIMRTLARVSVSVPDGGLLSSRLERLLNSTVSIKNDANKKYHSEEKHHEVDPGVLAQADFVYLSAPEKLKRITEYQTLRADLLKTRQIKEALNASDDAVYSSLADNMNEL
jgi:hypothetical protein